MRDKKQMHYLCWCLFTIFALSGPQSAFVGEDPGNKRYRTYRGEGVRRTTVRLELREIDFIFLWREYYTKHSFNSMACSIFVPSPPIK